MSCQHETIAALTPGGRVVDLEPDPVWVKADRPFPSHLFILGVAGRPPLTPHATPVVELADRERYTRGEHAGPFRKEHRCVL
jgi:hypothetical protein